VAQRTGGGWIERAYPVSALPDVLPAVAGETDVYLSTQRFWGWRRIAQLAECGALAIDLDYHRVPELREMHPLGVLEGALDMLQRAQIPAPSLAIASGRGLYLLWLHRPIPRAALPRWNACQRALWETLRPLGADRGALDAARVLRVIGTRHSKAQVLVEALTPPGEVWSFEDLADELLPVDRAGLHDLRVHRAARRPQERLWTPPEGFTVGTLWEARLSDLQRLRWLRHWTPIVSGHRDHWMFVAGVAMSWIAVPAVLRRELFALAKEAGDWTDSEARSRLQAIFKRAHMAAKGERVEWGGVKVDPRYRLRNATILELLEITGEEERHMKTIIGADERRRRDRERDENRRRAAGAMTREEYEGRAQDRRAEAARLRSEGLNNRQIAEALGISKRRVQQLLKEISEGGEKSLRLYGGVASPEGALGRSPKEGECSEGEETGDLIRDQAEVFELARVWFGLRASAGESAGAEQLGFSS
jgi:transcriptional regulator with XRE-family HTH domain